MIFYFIVCPVRKLLLLGMALYLSASVRGISQSQVAPFLIHAWQNQQGLPNNTVRAITQTRDGYLWIGTDAGLARFDGIHSRIFGLREGLKNLQIYWIQINIINLLL